MPGDSSKYGPYENRVVHNDFECTAITDGFRYEIHNNEGDAVISARFFEPSIGICRAYFDTRSISNRNVIGRTDLMEFHFPLFGRSIYKTDSAQTHYLPGIG